jgi:hypothetical protein
VFDISKQAARAGRELAQVYDKMDTSLFFQQLITLIFKPLNGTKP